MFNITKESDYIKNYGYLLSSVKDLLTTEKDTIANLSNITSFIKCYVKDLNWVGFYIYKEDELVLGPFQGMPACVRIKYGKGVCGTAAAQRKVLRIYDVHKFEGHIACDSNTNSEMVIPVFKKKSLFGVLDLDSPVIGRFTETDEEYFVKICEEISDFLSGCIVDG